MSDPNYTLTLRRLVAAWSDRAIMDAVRFVRDHQDLLPRELKNSQFYSLANVVRSTRRYTDIRRYIQNQGDKAGRAGRSKIQSYWMDLEGVLRQLEQEARALQKQAGSPPEGADRKALLDELHCTLVEAFVQHLVAHSLMAPIAERSRKKPS